jgi:hypothetical protein
MIPGRGTAHHPEPESCLHQNAIKPETAYRRGRAVGLTKTEITESGGRQMRKENRYARVVPARIEHIIET